MDDETTSLATRLTRVLRAAGALRAATKIERLYDDAYREATVDWLPRTGRLAVTITEAQPQTLWRQAEIELGSGPDEIYRYYPFLSYVYVDDRLQVILEFSEPDQRAIAIVRVPTETRSIISIVTELASTPDPGSDERELALHFWDFRVGRTIGPPKTTLPQLSSVEDFQSRQSVAIAKGYPRPVFVLGSYRSATSVLTWAIGQHPNLWPLEETGFLGLLADGALAGFRHATSAIRNFFEIFDIAEQEYFAHIGSSIHDFILRACERRAGHIALERVADKPGRYGSRDDRFQFRRSFYTPKTRWVDGTPENTANVVQLRKIFPLARFVCTVRHPYEVITSMVHFDRTGGKETTIDDAIAMWVRLMTWALLAAQAYGPQVIKLVPYEDLTTNPSSALTDIFSFIGEPDFPTAAQTFSRQINSSKPEPSERDAARSYLSKRPETDASLIALYETLLSMARDGWVENAGARTELEDRENDLLQRLVGNVS